MRDGHGLTVVVDLPVPADLDTLEQLLHLPLTHPLPQIAQNILQLPDPNPPRHLLIKHLKATNILLRLSRIPEPSRPVQDALESRVVEVWRVVQTTGLQVGDLCVGRVLAAGAEEVAEGGG